MQDRYVGDIGDYAKYGLLRALSKGKKLGVAWYLRPDEDNDDGMDLQYLLEAPEASQWRLIDEELFDGLQKILRNWITYAEPRCVAQVENRNLLPGATFAGELLKPSIPPYAWEKRKEWRNRWRKGWFRRVLATLDDCDIVFADPDNGLCDDGKFNLATSTDWKRLPLREMKQLSDGKITVIYHHNSRFDGGHEEEIKHWMRKLPGCTYAFRCRRGSARTFFIINCDEESAVALKEFACRWRKAERNSGIKRDKLSELITK